MTSKLTPIARLYTQNRYKRASTKLRGPGQLLVLLEDAEVEINKLIAENVALKARIDGGTRVKYSSADWPYPKIKAGAFADSNATLILDNGVQL